MPDTLFALCSLLSAQGVAGPPPTFPQIEAAYRFVEAMDWPQDVFDERTQLLSRLSYLAWRHCLALGSYGELTKWRERCVDQVLADESVRRFVALPFAERSAELNDRFLADPTVLLATCTLFEKQRNLNPRSVAQNAAAAFEWASAHFHSSMSDDSAFFCADLSLSTAGALRHLGRIAESMAWLTMARTRFSRLSNREVHFARTTLMELMILYFRHNFDEILRQLPAILITLHEQGAVLEHAYACLLEGLVLKCAGKGAKARSALSAIVSDQRMANLPMVQCLALVGLAEQRATDGSVAEAEELFERAKRLADDIAAPLVTGHLYGSLGETFRDQGRLVEAANAYRLAISIYSRSGMERDAAYIRVILAETLLGDGREGEAIVELLGALPLITAEKLDQECQAAVALLRESLRRKRLDVSTLRRLREGLRLG